MVRAGVNGMVRVGSWDGEVGVNGMVRVGLMGW